MNPRSFAYQHLFNEVQISPAGWRMIDSSFQSYDDPWRDRRIELMESMFARQREMLAQYATEKQLEVFALVATGITRADASKKLGTGQSTTIRHLQALARKVRRLAKRDSQYQQILAELRELD